MTKEKSCYCRRNCAKNTRPMLTERSNDLRGFYFVASSYRQRKKEGNEQHGRC
jgi:predicted lipoprotein with Yx(FWY)xxD motif